MKKGIFGFLFLGLIMCLPFSSFGEHHECCPGKDAGQKAAPSVTAGDDVRTYAGCKYCGMNREKFAFSRVLIEYDDGTSVGLCSIRCAAVDLANNLDKAPKSIRVGDYGTRQLVDAEKAFWVIGGSKQGVMTRQAKWAFANKADAEKFVKENGGKLATFDEALKAAYDDMYQDTRMIREKRKMMRMKMEKK
jgi:nitrous oxide reductase accessory protein NosL